MPVEPETLASSGPSQTVVSDEAPVVPTNVIDLSGTVLAGRYRLLRQLGAGGMGTVYLAEHTAIHKKFAVKVLAEEFCSKPLAVERFLREAQMASKIGHANVVEITDFGFSDEKVPFLTMEYLEGEELAVTVEREGALPWPRVRGIMLQILAALDAAHAQGIIHRDMKPQNCFRVSRPEGEDFIKVLDFGIAKAINDDADLDSLTSAGAVIGTVHYMSPEQAKSEGVDARTDVYSAGVIAYEMLTGQVPYDASSMVGVLSKLLTEEPPSMAEVAPKIMVHPTVEALVREAMAKDREARYPSAAAFAAAIRELPEDLSAVGSIAAGADAPVADDPDAGGFAETEFGAAGSGVLGLAWEPQGPPPGASRAPAPVRTSPGAGARGGSGLARLLVLGSLGLIALGGGWFAAQRVLEAESAPPSLGSEAEDAPAAAAEQEQEQEQEREQDLYAKRVAVAADALGASAPSLDQLRQPNVFHHPFARGATKLLRPGKSTREGPLSLSVRVDLLATQRRGISSKTKHTMLVVENRGEVPLAYRLDMRVGEGGECQVPIRIKYDAMVIDAGGEVEISVCSGKQSAEILDLRMLEITALGALWVRKVPVAALGLGSEVERSHDPGPGVDSCIVASGAHAQAIRRGEYAWEDLIDFYSRHDCAHYPWWAQYRRAEEPVEALPMLPP